MNINQIITLFVGVGVVLGRYGVVVVRRGGRGGLVAGYLA